MLFPRIRYATLNDVEAVRKIAVRHSRMVGFVRRNEIIRGVENRELFVADLDGQIAGFCNWHGRRDNWSTVYALAVDADYQGQGIGRALLYAVPCPISLKCIAGNPANAFYRRAGMSLVGTEPGRKNPLNVYELRVLACIVRGGNKAIPDMARQSGQAYGVQADAPFAWPWMVDIEWEDYDWYEHLTKVQRWHPVQAMAADYMEPAQYPLLMNQIRALRAAGVLRVMVCPKFHGAVKDIPQDCVVAISLRTAGKMTKGHNKYSGFMPDYWELVGRTCHLLGGSPELQKDTITKLHGVGARVLSVDGSAHIGSAGLGSVYHDGRWRRKRGEKANLQAGGLYSSGNIQRELQAAAHWIQPSLFQGIA